MANLTKKERDALPAEAFGDPGRRLFPITDQDDVDSAAHLIGKAKNPEAVKRRIIAIAKRKGLTIPDAWKAEMSSTSRTLVTFEGSGRYVSPDGEWAIYPNALLFEAGSFEDKGISISPEEMLAASADFAPVGGNIEHTDFMRGRACTVRSIRLDDEDAFKLRGEVALPLWLDERLDATEKRLSCEWDRDTKSLVGVALTTNPRVPEAALMSAYLDREAQFAGRRHSASDQRDMQDIHDITVRQGADCRARMKATPGGKGQQMSFKDKVAAWFSAGQPDEFDPDADASGVTPQQHGGGQPATAPMAQGGTITAPGPDPRIAEMQARLAQQDQQLAQLREERISREAQSAADALVLAGKALPAEREGLVAAFAQAARDDAQSGPVTFAGGQSISRVQQLVAAFSARPAHQLRQEMLPPQVSVLAAPQTGTQERETELQKVYDGAKAWAEKANGGRSAKGGK